MERCERNAEVQVLRLDDCYNISFDDVERLKEIVVDVIWDGVEQEVSSQHDSEEDYYDDDDGSSLGSFQPLGYDYDDFSSSL